MPRASLSLSFVFFTCLAVPSLLNGQRRPGSSRPSGGVIDVQVRYATGEPGPRGIHIRLEAAEGGSAGDCETVDGGKCQFRPTSNGVYLVRMNERGYKEEIVRVELIGTSQGYASLELKTIPGEAPADHSKEPGEDKVSVLEAAVPTNARQEFEKGRDALNDNKLDAGISHLRKAIKLHESFPSAYTLLGTAYLSQKNWKDAQLALQKAVALDPNSGEAYLALGAVFNQTKNYPEAETALEQGIKLRPDAPGGHYELAKTYWSMGRWQESAPHARKAVSDMPELAAPHVLLGNILLREGNAPQALQEYRAYLRLEPNGSMAPGVGQIIKKIETALHP
jgi:tetratricopeptide (TPR) repeat protein